MNGFEMKQEGYATLAIIVQNYIGSLAILMLIMNHIEVLPKILLPWFRVKRGLYPGGPGPRSRGPNIKRGAVPWRPHPRKRGSLFVNNCTVNFN